MLEKEIGRAVPWLLAAFVSACGVSRPTGLGDGGETGDVSGDAGTDPEGSPEGGCGTSGCYTVYAHSDHVLYRIDLTNRQLVTVGPFNAPIVGTQEDIMTDLAVSPTDDVIYVISRTNLYTASSTDGHVTLVGPITACGNFGVALTFTVDGSLYTGDFMGAFCRIDPTTSPPSVTPIGNLGSGLALAGDIVAVADGTMFGTAYRLSDPANTGTQLDNLLVRIDPTTGQATIVGRTGYPKLFGVAFDQGQVFGFTHDGSGRVVTLDPSSGVGTLYGTFTDPGTGRGISFSGAGVNAMVPLR